MCHVDPLILTRRVWSVKRGPGLCEGLRMAALRLRSNNELTALPESFGQLTALEVLYMSRASACAEWRCCSGFWTVELGER